MRSITICGEKVNLYEMEDLDAYLDGVSIRTKKARKATYINEACSFDIETTSTYIDGEKAAFMYIWQLSICDRYLIGRDFDDLLQALEYVKSELNISIDKRLVLYVHNLPYEFQFIRKYFEWGEVFSRDERKPIKAVTADGIEFRCSYALTNQSLESVAKDLPEKYTLRKLVGDLDYTLLRTPDTFITDEELGYCINDIRIVDALIKTKIEEDGDITKIPLTLTGYVRNYVRKYCLNSYDKTKQYKRKEAAGTKYKALMQGLKLDGKSEYALLKRAFCGGFTHSAVENTGKEFQGVVSYDITSSYPAVILSEKVPMSRGFNVDVRSEEDFRYNLENYACIFDIEFFNLSPKEICSENYISESKCSYLSKDAVVNNGRVAYASKVKTTITNIDFETVEEVYDFDSYRIGKFRCYKYGYFPKSFIECVLYFYKSKTELKGVKGREKEYMRQKGMLNSLYGMIVTDICKEDFVYDGEWGVEACNIDETIDRYNRSRKRFMFYPWGVFVAAYARRNLFKAINELKGDYIYSDTDSVKFKNESKHTDFFVKYNSEISKKVATVLKHYDIDPGEAAPKDINGIEHPIGIYTRDGEYAVFKTIGAKRYMVKTDTGEYKLTVAGLNKNVAMNYITKTYGDGAMDAFSEDLYIPKGEAGKDLFTYIDEEKTVRVTDYKGRTSTITAKSAIHLDAADYTFSVAAVYIKYLIGYREVYERYYG